MEKRSCVKRESLLLSPPVVPAGLLMSFVGISRDAKMGRCRTTPVQGWVPLIGDTDRGRRVFSFFFSSSRQDNTCEDLRDIL